MTRTRTWAAVLFAAFALSAGGTVPTAQAGLTDRLKKKVEDKVTKKVEGTADEKTAETPAEAPAEGAKANGPNEKVSEVSTKFDYVPGDKVLLYDDFTQDELGEFPAQWGLSSGTFEVAEMKGERWLRCVSANGDIRMNVPPTLPEFWTLEFDFYYDGEGGAIALTMSALAKDGSTVWQTMYPYSGTNWGSRAGPSPRRRRPRARQCPAATT